MARQIVMRMRDGRQGSITISRNGSTSIDLAFRRPDTPSVGIRLTTTQAEMLVQAIQDELADQGAQNG